MKESEKTDKYLDFVKELKESDGDTNCKWLTWNGHQRLEELETRGKPRPSRQLHCWDLQEYSEESWRPEEIWYLLDSNEMPSSDTAVKTLTRNVIF